MASKISLDKFKDLHDKKDVNLIDVRTPAEYNSKHIKGAFNVPLDRLAEHKDSLKNSKRQVVFICKTGMRSHRACQAVEAMGIENTQSLEVGVDDLETQGFETIKGKTKWDLERQVRFVAGLLVMIGVLLGFFLNQYFFILSGLIGFGLVFAAITNTCAMGMLLAKLPYNKY